MESLLAGVRCFKKEYWQGGASGANHAPWRAFGAHKNNLHQDLSHRLTLRFLEQTRQYY